MNRFEVSCTTCATRGIIRDEIIACFEYAPKAGYTHWGLAGPPLWDLGGARWFDWRSLKEQAAAAGLVGLTEVYGPSFPTESEDMAVAAADDIALLFGLATNLDCPLVVISGGSRRSLDFLGSTIAGLQELLRVLPDNGVRLALEPHFLSALERRTDFDAIFAAIDDPRLGITVDTGHFHMAREDWRQLIRDYPNKIYNVHVKDHLQYVSVPLGEGEIDLHGMVEELYAIEYQGALAVELEVRDPENLPRYVSEARRFLLRVVGEVSGARSSE